MNEQAMRAMFALIRLVVCGAELTLQDKEALTPELLPKLYALSKSHDMAHIMAQGLSDLGLLGEDEISQKFQKQQMLAVYRYQNLNHELNRICQTLEDAKIPFIPLKGSVLRQYYPAPWMRTSCDIDVLVHEEALDRAVALLEEKGYKSESKGLHDISLYSSGGIHLELHYETVEENRAVNANAILSGIWEHAMPKSADSSHMTLTDEMFYFYHVAHLAKHFENCGSGIRPFLDLWILEHCVEHDDTNRNALLQQGGLLTFANVSRRLSEIWFGDAQHDEVTEQMQSFVLSSGIYGTLDNRVAIQRNQHGGKIRYVLSRIFMPYDSLRKLYPILNKHKWLTPVMEVRRWFRILLKGRIKSSIREINVSQTISQEQVTRTAELLQNLGLDKSL